MYLPVILAVILLVLFVVINTKEGFNNLWDYDYSLSHLNWVSSCDNGLINEYNDNTICYNNIQIPFLLNYGFYDNN